MGRDALAATATTGAWRTRPRDRSAGRVGRTPHQVGFVWQFAHTSPAREPAIIYGLLDGTLTPPPTLQAPAPE